MHPSCRSPSGYGHCRGIVNALRLLLVVTGVALAQPAAPAAADPVKITAYGDSLSAGFGVAPEEAFPARLEAHLRAQGLDVRVANAGVSGDTSAGGLVRLGWVLADEPDIVILELGANDMLRGFDPQQTEANLDAMLREMKQRGIRVLLAGMYANRSLGRDYVDAFEAIYPRLAERYDVAFYPFFLDGVARQPELNQPDGLHPNAKGVDVIVERIAPYVRRLIEAE